MSGIDDEVGFAADHGARHLQHGYLIVEGVVDRALNRACESVRGGHLTDFVRSEAFRREVLLQPQVGGAARALLGASTSWSR